MRTEKRLGTLNRWVKSVRSTRLTQLFSGLHVMQCLLCGSSLLSLRSSPSNSASSLSVLLVVASVASTSLGTSDVRKITRQRYVASYSMRPKKIFHRIRWRRLGRWPPKRPSTTEAETSEFNYHDF